jgi:glucose uptake protein GlcU
MLGYLFALISSFFFSLYIIPRKLSKQKPILFTFLVTVGFFIGSLLVFLIYAKEKLNFYILFSIPAGVIWVISFVFFIKSIDIIGLSRSNQWKNLQGPIGVLLCLVILSEYGKVNPFVTLLAGLSIFASAFFLSNTSPKDKQIINRQGIYYGLLSGLGFGTVTVFNKIVTDHIGVFSQQVVWSLSMLICMLIYIIYKNEVQQLKNNPLKETVLGLSAGFLYLGASFFMLESYKFITASIGFSIIQLNSLWTIIIGVLVFKEISLKKYYKEILLGLFLALLGVILLTIAKN